MTLAKQGFLSPDVEAFRTAVRTSPRYAVWFEFAEELIREGLDILANHEVRRGDNQQLLLSGLFVRAHQSFQAAVILAEKGIVADARGIVRSAVETAIASIALAADPSFIDQMIGADGKHKITLARALLTDPDYKDRYSPGEIDKMEQTIKDLEAIDKSSPRAPKAINWKEVAHRHCKDLYMALYRLLSSDGSHATIDVMDRYFEVDATGEITAIKLGPDFEGLDDTLNAACLAYLWAAIPFASHFEYQGFRGRLDEHVRRYRQLARD
jgi:hypothetical protein